MAFTQVAEDKYFKRLTNNFYKIEFSHQIFEGINENAWHFSTSCLCALVAKSYPSDA